MPKTMCVFTRGRQFKKKKRKLAKEGVTGVINKEC